MFNKDEIYDMLSTGTSIDEIADQFTKALNQAQAQYQEDHNQKFNDFVDVVDHIFKYAKKYYPTLLEEINMTDEDYKSMMTEVDMYVDIMKDLPWLGIYRRR